MVESYPRQRALAPVGAVTAIRRINAKGATRWLPARRRTESNLHLRQFLDVELAIVVFV